MLVETVLDFMIPVGEEMFEKRLVVPLTTIGVW
jgi:hypothetical protein